jgi:hypothetical protein
MLDFFIPGFPFWLARRSFFFTPQADIFGRTTREMPSAERKEEYRLLLFKVDCAVAAAVIFFFFFRFDSCGAGCIFWQFFVVAIGLAVSWINRHASHRPHG